MSDYLKRHAKSPFEEIKKVNEYGSEYWSARDLMAILGYVDYRNFLGIINKAITACENSGENKDNHFGQVNEMVDIGSNAKRERENYYLSRYACYLVVQNADSSKEAVALGQTYFAIQTRKQENFESLSEDEKRLHLRNEMRNHNSKLADAAKEAGVIEPLDYAIFQNSGYKGLYGGLDNKAIKEYKGLNIKKDLLDHIGSTELAANLFRATQTEEKLIRDRIKGKVNANKTHYEVGKKVRETIVDLGGTMPEDLPIAKSIKEIEKEKSKVIKGKTTYTLKAPQNNTKAITEKVRESSNNYMPDDEWKAFLNKLKTIGKMTMYTILTGAKAVIKDGTLFIYFSEKNGFSKTLMSKPENKQIIKQIISETYQCDEIVIKTLNISN